MDIFKESWDRETDALLDSILTGSDDKLVLSLDGSGPFSDTSSDSGCNLLSPSNYEIPNVSSPERPSSIDFIGYMSNDDDEQPLHAVDPISISSPIVEERISVTNTDEEEEEIDVKPIIPFSGSSSFGFPNGGISSNTIAVSTSPTTLLSSPKKTSSSSVRNSLNSTGAASSTTTPLQAGGTTTILLPVIKSVRQTVNLNKSTPKRRRASLSSNDSGHDDGNNTTIVHGHSLSSSSTSTSPPAAKQGKYLALELTSEEQRLCEREGIKLPSHYPLSREEEKNLKRIRRKIRNKESAQHSRRRKKEYVDSMEDRVRICTEENEELKSKIQLLETQNKTLASQLRRLHQIIVSGGGFNKQNQTSTALMVLLLSTALFLIPGFQNKTEAKTELDIPSSVKVSSSDGHSRSLLQFSPSSLKSATEYVSANEPESPLSSTSGGRKMSGSHHHFDHDYLSSQKVNNYIEDDVPPRGYGPSIVNAKNHENKKPTSSLEDRRLNVNISHGAIRTVLLHVPKDIK